MKTHTDNILPTYQILGPALRINFDEQSVVVDNMGQTHTAYEYQTAVVELGASRSKVIEAIIACKYSPGAEMAAVNDGGDKYIAYQAFRAQAKALADAVAKLAPVEAVV